MKPAIEPPSSLLKDASMVAFEREESSFPWNWHYHPEFELTLITAGRGTRLVGDHSEHYNPGDLVLLGANLPHTWFSCNGKEETMPEEHRAIVVQFRREMLPETVLALPEFTAIQSLLAEAARGLRFPAVTVQEIAPEMEALVHRKGLPGWLALVELLGKLAGLSRAPLASPGHRHRSSTRLSLRMERIVSHLEKHYREDLPVAGVARMVGLSSGTFSRFFRKMARQTYVEYRNGLRIREACRLLEESDLSVTEIAYECGFNNLANFNRRFRAEKRMSPRHYRQLHNPGGPGPTKPRGSDVTSLPRSSEGNNARRPPGA